MTKTIHLFASLGNRKKTAAGGGQTSSRRLVNVLEFIGYDVQVINRTTPPYACISFCTKMCKIIGCVLDPIRFFFHLLFRRRKHALVMVIGYAGNILPYYFLFMKISRMLGYKTIFYMKGGFTRAKYNSFSNWLKICFVRGLKNANIAMYEAEEGAILSAEIMPETPSQWLPNYVERSFTLNLFPEKTNKRINLLYFGRIHPKKNVIMIIDVFDLLCKSYPNIYLTIVGSGERMYEKKVTERIESSYMKERINYLPRTKHEKLKEILAVNHFFLFPSVEPQEGHSNALNEAMSYGLVPIVNGNNFLPSIVGNSRLVANELKPEAYCKIITDVIESGDYEYLSREMYERVQHNFTQKVIEKKLKKVIESI